jgi:cytochrome c oxidase subunit III
MASFTPTVSISDPSTALGRNDIPPPTRDGGDDDHFDYGSPDFPVRLRRARLGLAVGVTGIVMIFVSFTSAYLVRQGLPTLDPRTDTLVHDWLPVQLPRLLLINTAVLLISSVTMELARRQVAREATLAQVASIPGVSLGREDKIPWLALTVVLGLSFLTGQWMAWRELAASGFYVATSPSSSFVYLLTGMHGLHLLGGVLALLAAGAGSLLRKPVESRSIVLDVTGWYWHFMAFLWIYILCLLEFAR